MVQKEFAYKMGRNWLDKFLDSKRKSRGWSAEKTDDGNFVVFRPSKRLFALFDPKTGLVHTTANIMDVQW